MKRELALKIVLAVVGLLFVALGYPMLVFIRQEPALSMQFSLSAGRGYASGLPGSYLEVMSLQPLLSLVGMLGRRRMVVDNDSDRRNSQRIVFAAASVLADWPNNFLRLLREITEEMPTDSSAGVARGRLSGIYRDPFKPSIRLLLSPLSPVFS